MSAEKPNPPQSVAAYICTKSWESALPAIRIVGPAKHAGLSLIKGNQWRSISPEAVRYGDVVVIQRDWPRFTDAYHQIIERAHAEGKPVICDVDDLLLELPGDHPDQRSHYYQNALIPTLRGVLEADAVTVATPALCTYLRAFNPNTWLLPNYLDDNLWSIRAELPEPNHLPVTLGFMGGEAHQSDLELVVPVLLELLRQHGSNLRFKFWGIKPPPELAIQPTVEWIPFEKNYTEFATFFSSQSCDVFVAPLVDNPFNRCKSAIKFLEYSALGVPGVYSRVLPYESVVMHQQNGFLAATADEWKQFLSKLIESPDLRIDIGLRARQTVVDHWLLSKHAHEWVETYERAAEIARQRQPDRMALRVLEQVQRLQRESDLIEREEILAEKERDLAALKAKIEEMTDSAGWRLVLLLRRIRVRLAPYGSRRERLLGWFLKRLRRG